MRGGLGKLTLRMDRVLARRYSASVNVRLPDLERRERDRGYKKGWEARIPVDDDEQLADLLSRLDKHGIPHGRPYAKTRQRIVPVYGREAVARLLRLLGLDTDGL